MTKKTKPDVWTLDITELPESPFTGERRRKVTRFQGTLRRNGGHGHYFWGHTREQVIAKAEAKKARLIAWCEAKDNVERIEI